ncbi:tRNA pseudouridine(38-40) synthase TruA [Tepidiforma sp.]|uniref:tRNA pseudouridine(38-40) synthase TruA n=1 Tax=Tepidiforma sp. TaxID=2682230 RepID=UPI002ADE0FE1|nr:tRNA pseudouridine(38-40) synthase TruA [Tepidiforma sp.]
MTARRFAATVSYDGTDFVGSQLQPNGRTVQQELERAASQLFQASVRVHLAGRTDAGVHARGQVAAFTALTRHDAATIGRALNALLPEDVAVRAVREVPLAFDPRRWARRRWYRYTISNGEARDPLARRFSWHIEGNLDLDAMQELAAHFIGRRDFRAFAGVLEPGRSPVRTVFATRVHRSGDVLHFDIEADAYLPQMVRRLTAALARVGRHAATQEEIVSLLEQARPGSFTHLAPARGLCLERVWYDEGYTP